MSDTTPIVLLASERSGTNLLRAIMETHSDIASPPPFSLIDLLASCFSTYFPLGREAHIKELVEDAILLTQSHLNPWEIDLGVEQVIDQMKDETFWSLFQTLNDIYAKNTGASHWFSKEPGLFRHIYEIALHMPNAKFIYMVRDGRDVGASMLKAGLHETHIYNAAKHWSNDQKLCINAISDKVIKERTLLIKYEDIITSPNASIKGIMEFVGLDFQSEQLSFYKNDKVIAHANKSEFWKNIAQPINASNSGEYKTKLSSKEIEIFENVAWREMEALDYPLDTQCRKPISRKQVVIFRMMAELRKRFNKKLSHKEVSKHRKRNDIFSKILSRSFEG